MKTFKMKFLYIWMCMGLHFVLSCDTKQGMDRPVALSTMTLSKPDHTQHAQLARWLVHLSDWGFVSTISNQSSMHGGAYVNSLSISDGVISTGRLLFYLTPLDLTTKDLLNWPKGSLGLCEAQLLPNGCSGRDPESPTCVKVSFYGEFKKVPQDDLQQVERMMFQRHTHMEEWPSSHGFEFWELHPEIIHILDWFGGVHEVSVEEYFEVNLQSFLQ